MYDSFQHTRGWRGHYSASHLKNFDNAMDLRERKYSLVYYLLSEIRIVTGRILKLYDPDEEILPCNGMIVIARQEETFSGLQWKQIELCLAQIFTSGFLI